MVDTASVSVLCKTSAALSTEWLPYTLRRVMSKRRSDFNNLQRNWQTSHRAFTKKSTHHLADGSKWSRMRAAWQYRGEKKSAAFFRQAMCMGWYVQHAH